MATGSQQVPDEYEQLKELLELYPNISIIRTEGQPPTSYEIEYHLRGYIKEDDDSVGIGLTHRVQLSLPFGYPHFAPIAKPLTPIFHPDFDPAAVRLADRWRQKPSLPELVLHIGEMICGIAYNLEDPFNQEAADWYEYQKDQLPLDSISLADIEPIDIHLPDSLDDEEDDDDDVFTSLRLERDSLPGSRQPADGPNIYRIRTLVEQNKIFTANELLTALPEDIPFPDREEIQLHIGKVLRKSDQLFKLAEQLEAAAKFGEAMEVTDILQNLAADVPGVDVLKARIQKAMQLAPPAPGKSGRRAAVTPEVRASSPPIRLPGKSLPGLSAFSKPIMAAILILSIAILATFLFFKDENTLSRSQANVLKGQMLIEKKQFEDALETLEGAKAMLSDLTILRFRKGFQEEAVDTLISSPALQEGLKGRVLYQGEYIPVSDAAALEELTVLTDQAQALVGQDKIVEALILYRQALKFTTDRKLGKQQAAINEIVQSLELRQALATAEKAEQSKNWDEAAGAYRKALTLSGNMMSLGTASDITSRMTAATFRRELDQSKKAFTQSQWRETIKYLEQAQQAIDANPSVVTDKERQDLRRLLTNSRLYLMLSTAREAFQQKNWAQAITEYQNALSVLTDAPEAVENVHGESLGKIAKTLLMVKIAQIQDQILENDGREDPARTLDRYRDIQRLIKESAYQDDSAVKNIAQKIAEKADKQQEVIVQREKIAWLEEHFEEIFRANFPTFKGSKLSQPKAVFLRKISGRMVFTLTCLERSPGSSSKLELNYQFDSSSGRWSIYND